MIDKDKRELIEGYSECAILFDEPSYDKSIIGVSTDGNVVYNLQSMVEELASESDMTEEEALDFIGYNTVRMLPYLQETGKPIIVDLVEEFKNGR